MVKASTYFTARSRRTHIIMATITIVTISSNDTPPTLLPIMISVVFDSAAGVVIITVSS